MSHFLLVYDRNAHELIRQEQFAASTDAMEARFSAEREFVGRPDRSGLSRRRSRRSSDGRPTRDAVEEIGAPALS